MLVVHMQKQITVYGYDLNTRKSLGKYFQRVFKLALFARAF